MDRRTFLHGTSGSLFGLSLRSLITGLPTAFLMSPRAMAQSAPSTKYVLLAHSQGGESINASGPGSFAREHFSHANGSHYSESVVCNGVTYTADDLSATMDYVANPQGGGPLRIARCFGAFGDMIDSTAFFHYRTTTGIHPQFPVVRQLHGRCLDNVTGRGVEDFGSALTQELHPFTQSVLAKPILLARAGGKFQGQPLIQYQPTELASLIRTSVEQDVPPEKFAAARNYVVDSYHRRLRREGTPQQKRYFDNNVKSQLDAQLVGERLGGVIDSIDGDTLLSQMNVAALLFKLNIASVVKCDHVFSGDNHQPDGLTTESELTLNMMKNYCDFFQRAEELEILEQCLYATFSVFGRGMKVTTNGRGHNRNLSTGMLIGKGFIEKQQIGGIDPEQPGGHSMPFDAATKLPVPVDQTGPSIVPVNDSIVSYCKSVMRAAGVPQDRVDARFKGSVPTVDLLA